MNVLKEPSHTHPDVKCVHQIAKHVISQVQIAYHVRKDGCYNQIDVFLNVKKEPIYLMEYAINVNILARLVKT